MAGSTYSPEELAKLKKIEIEILKTLIDVCDQLGIEYFADGGTCLGAIRHGGFIPWDDDIDVGMTRTDYERFLKEAPALLPENYILQTPHNEKNSPFVFSKVRVNGTEFIEYSCRGIKMHHGVYVDIFPYDEMANDLQQAQKDYKRCKMRSRLFGWRQLPRTYQPPVGMMARLQAIIRKILHTVLQVVPASFLLRRVDAVRMKYYGKDTGWLGKSFESKLVRHKRETIFPTKKWTFEGLQINIPGDHDQYLTNLYGDYMTFPPEEERVGHRPWRMELN